MVPKPCPFPRLPHCRRVRRRSSPPSSPNPSRSGTAAETPTRSTSTLSPEKRGFPWSTGETAERYGFFSVQYKLALSHMHWSRFGNNFNLAFHSITEDIAILSNILFLFFFQMGGAMAPPMKELPRWLLENPEFAIAPDWTDIVKQSVSLLSFTRLALK